MKNSKLVCPVCRDRELPPRIGWNAYKVPADCCPVCWYRYGRCIPLTRAAGRRSK